MLDIYATFAEQDLAIPVWKGPKPSSERFPGAVETYSIEAMMQDGKALQAGTSHFLGQNFAKAQNIPFTDKTSQEAFCWTTSWGVSTRLIGGLIMTHADDDGLVLPPRIAPEQIVLLPIYRSDEDQSSVMNCCHKIKDQLEQSQWRNENIRVTIDDRDMRGGDKVWQHIKQGVPVRVEIGPRDLAAGTVSIARRDEPPKQKFSMPLEDFPKKAADVSQQDTAGFAYVHVADDPAVAEALDPLKVTVRCTPMDWDEDPGKCLYTGKSVSRRSVISRSY